MVDVAGRIWIKRGALLLSPAQVSQVISPELRIYWWHWDLRGWDSAKQEHLCPCLNSTDGSSLAARTAPGPPSWPDTTPTGTWTQKKKLFHTISWKHWTQNKTTTRNVISCRLQIRWQKNNNAVGVNTNFIIQYLKSNFSTCPLIACIVLQFICWNCKNKCLLLKRTSNFI